MNIRIGIDVGGTFTKYGFFDEEFNFIKKWYVATDINNNGKNIAKNISNEIHKNLKDNYNLLSIGVGIPGFSDKNGKVFLAGNIGWKNYDFKKDLQKYFNIPISINNDVQMHGFGEKQFGEAKTTSNFILIALGTGLGSAIFIDDKLYKGSMGTAGEIGHQPYQDKFKCSCGLPYCIEPIFSATGLINIYNYLLNKKTLDEKSHQEIDGSYIIGLANRGDEVAINSIKELAKHGAKLCASLIMVLNPEKIIFSGGITINNKILIDELNKELKKLVHKFILEKTKVIISNFSNEAGILGAAYSGSI